MHWKDFLYFQRGEKIGVILLLIVIVLIFILNAILPDEGPFFTRPPTNDSLEKNLAVFREQSEHQSIEEPALLDEFTENDLERLKPYLSFE